MCGRLPVIGTSDNQSPQVPKGTQGSWAVPSGHIESSVWPGEGRALQERSPKPAAPLLRLLHHNLGFKCTYNALEKSGHKRKGVVTRRKGPPGSPLSSSLHPKDFHRKPHESTPYTELTQKWTETPGHTTPTQQVPNSLPASQLFLALLPATEQRTGVRTQILFYTPQDSFASPHWSKRWKGMLRTVLVSHFRHPREETAFKQVRHTEPARTLLGASVPGSKTAASPSKPHF